MIPGTEVTTYHGHYNSIGSSAFPDFRGGPVIDQTGTQLAPTVLPASQLRALEAGGGWTQVNHPTIFPGAPTLCRGCPWDWTDAETDYSHVDAIELQTGPADIGTSQNPFTKTAIAFYEARLAQGFHIAAVGSSDSHQADKTDITTAPIGRATTVVHAAELSQSCGCPGNPRRPHLRQVLRQRRPRHPGHRALAGRSRRDDRRHDRGSRARARGRGAARGRRRHARR